MNWFLPRGFIGGLTFCFCSAALATTSTFDPYFFTLPQALSEAGSVNRLVLIGEEQIRQAEDVARRERAGLLPRVDVQLQQRRTQSAAVGREDTAAQMPTNRFDAKLVGSVPLFNTTATAAYRAARLGVEISELGQEALLQDVYDAVGRVYLLHLRNKKRFEVIESNIERAQTLLSLARSQHAAGVVTRIDVTRAEAQLAAAEQARLQQQTVLYESELHFKRLLDLDPNRPLVLADFDVSPVVSYSLDLLGEEELWDRHPEYRQAIKEREQRSLEERAARLQRLPNVSVFGEYGRASARAFDRNDNDAWLAGLSVSVPLFEGFRIPANQRIAASRRRTQEHRIRDLEQLLSAEIRFAVQDADSRAAQIAVAQKNEALAQEELRLARLRYEQGVADNREVVDAQDSLARAGDNLVEAIFRFNLSRLELARVQGDVRLILDNP